MDRAIAIVKRYGKEGIKKKEKTHTTLDKAKIPQTTPKMTKQ